MTVAPSRPPTLKNAWNPDMIGRAAACWTAIACAFIATSIAPSAAPNTKSVPASIAGVGCTASAGKARQAPTTVVTITGRLPQ